MSLLDDYTLAQIRAAQNEALPDTCTIVSGTVTVNDTGTRSKDGWGTVAADVSCRMRPQAIPREQQMAMQMSAPMGYIFSMAYDGTLDPAYRIIYDGGTYEVVGVVDTGSWSTVVRAICVKAEPS